MCIVTSPFSNTANPAFRLDTQLDERGKSWTVARIEGEGTVRRRLMEMGLLPGTRVQVLGRAPFGDPIEIRLRGYRLSIRVEEAKCVWLNAC